MQIPLSRNAYLVDGERAINLFPVFNASKRQIEFNSIEGKTLRSIIGAAPIRGLYVASNDDTKLHLVAGNRFYVINTDWTFTQNAVTLGTSTGMVEFSNNRLEITVTDGTYGYTYTPATGVFAKIDDADFPGSASHCFLDGYTVSIDTDSETMRTSDLYDSRTWSGIDFGDAEGIPDKIIRCSSFSGNLWLFGVVSTEVFGLDPTASEGLPFSRIGGAVLEFGLSAKYSLAKNAQAMYFLARTVAADGERVIVEVRGYQARIVSTQGINELLAGMSNIANAEGFAYMREGHSFYELTFPTDNITIVYDASENKWHERRSLTSAGKEIRNRSRCYAYFNGHHVVGDFEAGKIYTLDASAYTENGRAIIRKLITPEVADTGNNRKFTISEVIVPMKVGVGNATTDLRYEAAIADGSVMADGSVYAGSATANGGGPQLMMRYSKDKGKTWSSKKMTSFGKQGDYTARPRFGPLGQGRHWNFELSVSDAVEVKLEGPLIVPR